MSNESSKHHHHDHEHGHHHHDHDHGHETGAPLTAAKPAPHAAPLPPETVEDTGTRALSEALRSSFLFLKVIMVLLVIGLILSCIRTVEPNQVAVILRFGKPVGVGEAAIRKPGLHWAFPYPIDEIVTISVGESHTVVSTAGWFAQTPAQEALGQDPEPKQSLAPGVDNYTLTADGNIIHVRATLKYRITDPISYAFNFANVDNLLKNIVDNALHYASAHFTADAALYKDRTAFREKVRERVVELVESANLGITLEPINVETRAPLFVKSAFDAVLESEQERSQMISAAQGYAEETTRKAIGEAKAIVSAGITHSNQVVHAVSAEAKYFTDQLPHYLSNPGLFRQRLQTETMEKVMTKAEDKFHVPNRADGKSRELRIQLSREPQKPTTR